jgi:hypothetical protein
MGPAYTTRKYASHMAGAGDENEKAYIRIYK